MPETLTWLSKQPTAKPYGKLEIYWDAGTGWVDETSFAILPITGSCGITSPGDSLSDLGKGPVAEMSVQVDNETGRYSVDVAGSLANTYGIFQKQIRFTAGYYNSLGVALTQQMFIGRIQQAPLDAFTATAQLSCYGFEHDIQQHRIRTEAYGDGGDGGLAQNTNAIIALVLALTGLTITYNPDFNYIVVPWWYGEDDDAYTEMREAAESELGVVWVNPQTGYLEFWSSAYWVGKASTDTYTFQSENAKPDRDYSNIFDKVVVHYQPRRKGRTRVLYQLQQPITIAPATTGTIVEMKLQHEQAQYVSFNSNARTAGGASMTTSMTITIIEQTARLWRVQFDNSNVRHALVVDTFNILGRPLEGMPDRFYEANAAVPLTVSRRTDIRATEERARFAMQTYAQAKLIGDLKVFRTSGPPPTIMLGPMPCNPTLNVGSIITLDLSAVASVAMDEDVILLSRNWSFGNRFEDNWYAVVRSYMDTLIHVSDSVTPDGYFKIGVSHLDEGKLYR